MMKIILLQLQDMKNFLENIKFLKTLGVVPQSILSQNYKKLQLRDIFDAEAIYYLIKRLTNPTARNDK